MPTPSDGRTGKLGEEFPVGDGRSKSGMSVLRLPTVCRVTGLARSTIYGMQAEGQFPKRIKLAMRAVGWVEQEVLDWLANRIKNRMQG
jgi:prophage regulatory protein